MNSIEPQAPTDGKPVYTWDHSASNQVWLAKTARDEYGLATFYADAWSAPGWMKTNGRDDEGGYLVKNKVADYVDYLVEYVRAWSSEGISLAHIGIVNEPNVVKEYATMGLGNETTNSTVATAFDIIRPLRATLNLSTGISCCEAQGWSMARDLLEEVRPALDDLSVVTTHAYKGDPAAPDVPLNTTLPVWITENSPIMHRLNFSQVWHANSSENEGLVWANNLHTALVDGNVSAYLYWIGAGPSGQEAPLVWLADDGGYKVATTYWAMAHWGRFIRPGSRRVEVERSEAIKTSAYVNTDGSVVIQAINNADRNATIFLLAPDSRPRQARSITAWLTDNSHHLQNIGTSYPENGQALDAVLPPRSLTTFHVQYRWLKTDKQ
ncbi:hypothetical protein Sste5346_009904 [Sporothrix stenoceras]|uniref:Glycoside hydrolase family 30 protein n=1 Tax=Sporothrix stenoceras TaxID=5173 RepID=A0ABR3YIP6_9PEZI